MNKIYKVVWNTVRNCYVVGSELISSKSGRHSTSNGKSSSLKVTLTVLALCGMTALGSGVAPAYAADAGTAVASQYVAVLVNTDNNYYYTSRGRKVQYGDTRDFDGHSYHKETVSGETYWVRDGYSIKFEENERYPGAQKDNIIKAYKTSSYTTASDEGLLKSNQIMVESAGISTLTGVDLDNVSGGTYVGATNSGSASTPSSFNYMIKDDNGTYVDAGNTNFSKRFKAATKNTDGTYSYNGEVIANDNLYVVNEQVGVFLTSSGKVYTGKVFGANNEVLMTTKSDEGTMYSYWGADTPDPNTKLADMTIGQFNQALEKVNNNSKAIAGDTIKEIKTTAKTEGGTDGGTIDLVRRGQYNSATGQYEGEYTVGDGITITSHGGTNGEDVKINFSNGTTGFDVAAGSKVEAVGTKEATTGLKINGETYNIKTGQNNYVSSATLNDYDELVLTREGLGNLKVDLSPLTRGLSSTDYQLVANKNRSDGKYTVSNGEVTLTVKDMNNLSNTEVKNITISGLASQDDLTHYFSVDAPPDPLPGSSQIGNYDNDGAKGNRSIAIGVKASATGDFSVAIGSGQNDAGSTASGDYATAVGNGSLAEGADSTALGYNATALGEDSVAIGYTSVANGQNSMALGVEARAGNNGSQADYATAVGALAHVDAVDGTALGQNAEVNSEKGTALGSTSKVHAAKGTAIGAYTSVTAEGGVAIGQASVADREAGRKGYNPLGEASNTPTWTATDGAVSLGSDSDGSSPHTRQITNLAAGTADTDAVNVAQLKNTKIAITNEYTKYVTDNENYVTGGSINGDTITLNRLQGGDVTITGLKEYVEGKDSYVTGASLKDNKLTITQNNNKGNYEIDLSDFANQFSGTDYRVVANPAEGSQGIYKPDANGNIALTVQDTKTGATSTVQLSDIASATTVNNNYTTLDTKINTTETKITNAYTKKINDTKIAITNEYTKYVTDTENYVTGGSINGDTITLNRLQGGDVTITGLKEYVEGKDSYVTGASLKDNKLTITQNNNKGNYEIDLSDFANQFSGTDYRVVANPAEGSQGIYKPDANGNIALTVQDTKTGATSTVQLSDIASATTVNNNYTTLDTKINTTETKITNAYTKKINDTKIAITNEYRKYVADTEDYVTSGSISNDTITLKRALGGEVTITGLKDYVEGLDSYVTGASLKDNKLTITQNNDKGNYVIDLSGFADQFSGTDYRVVANPAKDSGGIYKPDASGNIELTVEDAKTGEKSTVQLSDLASATTVTNNYNTLNTKVDAAKTTLADGKNTTVEASTAEDGHTEYKVNLNEDVNLGDTIYLNGSDGSISAKSGGAQLAFNNSGLTVSQAKNGLTNETRIDGATITVDGGAGNQTIINGSTARIGSVLVNGGSGTATISGLTNQTTKYDGFANGSGRAATEEQLKEVDSKATAAKTTVTNGKNITVDEAKAADGSSTYTVGLETDVVLGDNAIKLNGSDGSISAKSGGAQLAFNNSGLTVSQAKNGLTNETRIDGATITVDGGAGNQTIINGSTARIGSVLVNGGSGTATISGLTNQTTKYDGFANGSGRAATEEQLKEVDSKATAAKTTVTNGKNITVNEAKADDGSSTYTVGLETDVVLGDNAIKLNGSDGSISATSGTSSLNFNNNGLSLSNDKSSTVINGGTITVNGGESVISGTQATFGKIKLNAESGSTITGLSNTTTKYDGFATAGRAATEEQLKEVAGQAGEAIETAGKGWNLTTNKGTATNIAPGGTVDFSSSNDNLLISNAGADLSFSLSDNLDLTKNDSKKGSVKVGENTTLTDELLQVGKDVSLTASALRVGASSLTTDALMVGGLTYINSSGINANGNRITGVAAGIDPTDAVNVSQLKSAISGSQVSIDAGTGIIVEKTGNKYTIKTNIEGLSNDHGTVTVSTNKDSAPVTDSGTNTPAHAKRLNAMLLANDLAVVPETTTLTGDTLYVKHSANSVKLITDDITDPEAAATLNDGEMIDFIGGKNITTSSGHDTDADGKNYDKVIFSLKDDISLTSVTADKVTINNGPTINENGIDMNGKNITNTESITINNGPTINSSGIDMNSQKITNLADGEIAEGSTDAVNGGQLYNTNQAVIANAENINSLSHSLNKLDSRINRVGAGAAALAALHPLDFDPDNKWDFAAGYGNYAGANAVAIGTYYRPNENTMFSIGGSFGGGENMINAGVSFKLGSGGSGITTSKTVMAKKIKEQDELLKAQDAKMKEQDEKIAKLEALVAQQGEMIQQALGKK